MGQHTTNEERFEFDSPGESIVSTLYLPEGTPRAAAVTTGPLTSIKEQAAGACARAMVSPDAHATDRSFIEAIGSAAS